MKGMNEKERLTQEILRVLKHGPRDVPDLWERAIAFIPRAMVPDKADFRAVLSDLRNAGKIERDWNEAFECWTYRLL